MTLRLLERLLAFDPRDRASTKDVPFCFSFPFSYTDLNSYLSLFWFCFFTGTIWSILQWFVKLRAWTINTTNLKAWVWFREKEVNKWWCQRINLPRGNTKSISSSTHLAFLCSLMVLTVTYLWKKNIRYWSIILRCWRNTSTVVISLASCTLG